MAETELKVPLKQLADQVGDLLASGGTLGDVYNYDERDYEVLYALGHSLYNQGRYSDAMKAFGFLVMHNHLERRFVIAFASSLHMTRSFEKAIEFYSLASVMDMGDPAPTFHTAECLIQLGRPAEAYEALRIVIAQCASPERKALGERAQALRALIQSSVAQEEGKKA